MLSILTNPMAFMFALNSSVTIDTIISAVTSLVTAAAGWLTAIATSVSGSPLLLFFVVSGFVGIAVGLLMRFVRR